MQIRLDQSRNRFNIVPAGRRSFKTERAKRKVVFGSPYWPGALTLPGGRFFAAGPTQGQAKRIFWQDLKDMTGPWWANDPSESELVITLTNGASIHVLGLDEPARIEGVQWHGGVLDEVPDMKKGVFAEHVQPVTADTGAWVDMIGVPDFRGRNIEEYKQLFDACMMKEKEGWGGYTWKSADVLPAHVIEEAKRTLPLPIYRQEYEASFETAPGRAYYEFSKQDHLRPTEYIPGLPVHISMDFNRGHHVWNLYQVDPLGATKKGGFGRMPLIRCFDELYMTDATALAMANAMNAKLDALGVTTAEIYGDASGDQMTANADHATWATVKSVLPVERFNYWKTSANPPIDTRCDAVNVALRNALGEVGLQVDKRCYCLVRDLEYVTRAMLYGGSKTGELTHASDNLGYFVWRYTKLHALDNVDYSKAHTALR